MLPDCNDTKERMSLAYLRAVAARCRAFVTADEGGDYASIDATVMSALQPRRMFSVQLKCSSAGFARVDGSVAFDLAVRSYDHLRRTDPTIPCILLLYELPSTADDWMAVTPDNLTMRKAAWWTDLYGAKAVANDTTVRVHIPEDRRLTPDSMQSIFAAMDRLANGAARRPLYDL